MAERGDVFFARALESLQGAESEFANHRYNNTANRAYYACFQGAIAALQAAEIRPQGERWSHRFVQSQLDGLLINRRKRYPSELRGVLAHNEELRLSADYVEGPITETEAVRALQRTRTFLRAVRSRRGEP
jgi:uncharacterized protein (UPF0332 family)